MSEFFINIDLLLIISCAQDHLSTHSSCLYAYHLISRYYYYIVPCVPPLIHSLVFYPPYGMRTPESKKSMLLSQPPLINTVFVCCDWSQFGCVLAICVEVCPSWIKSQRNRLSPDVGRQSIKWSPRVNTRSRTPLRQCTLHSFACTTSISDVQNGYSTVTGIRAQLPGALSSPPSSSKSINLLQFWWRNPGIFKLRE